VTAAFDFDVAIVGGGPAGSSTALHLVRRVGVDPSRLVVFDKAKFPRDKPCAGAVSELGVKALDAIGVPIGVPAVPMRGVRVLAGGDVGETEAPMGVVVRRSELDAHLLETAREGGVEVRDGEGVTAIERVAGGFRIATSSSSAGDRGGGAPRVTTARFLAACDGAGSSTRKLLGVREPERRGHLYVLETAPRAGDSGCARGLIDFDLSVLDDGMQGYYWDFPTVIDGAPAVSRGIYHANMQASSQVKAALAKALELRGIDIATVKLKPFSTRPFVPGSTTWLKRVVLVGEAAGIDQTTGEGIAQAIAMGAIAARHLAPALVTDAITFEGYDRDVRSSTIGRHLLQSAWLAKHVYGSFGRPARRFLLGSSYARRAAIQWYRGEPLSIAAHLRLGLGLAATALAALVERPHDALP
jgi:flavin-dependent dehydrogenase